MTARIYHILEALPDAARGCVVAIGNFDGVHRGHQALLAAARKQAALMAAPAGALTFEPHPRQFFHPRGEGFRLTLLPQKARLLEAAGMEHIFAPAFDEAFSRMTPEEFISDILVGKIAARHIFVGADFSFGRGRSGTVETLRAAAAKGMFGLSIIPPVSATDGSPYSSSSVRACLRRGVFGEAAALLGWPWHLEAPVISGDRRGRTLGFPTANQDVRDYVQLPHGIYAVRARVEGESAWRPGVASFGLRPMFATERPVFETFIFDFSCDIYGKILQVRPVRHLRPERDFADIKGLIAQMKEDCIAAAAVLKSSDAL